MPCAHVTERRVFAMLNLVPNDVKFSSFVTELSQNIKTKHALERFAG